VASFGKDQVSAFQTYITLIEKDNISATEVAMNIDILVNNNTLSHFVHPPVPFLSEGNMVSLPLVVF
jgi:hypothetical protein